MSELMKTMDSNRLVYWDVTTAAVVEALQLREKVNWTKTTVLTPLALQRFPSHMNSLLQTLGW